MLIQLLTHSLIIQSVEQISQSVAHHMIWLIHPPIYLFIYLPSLYRLLLNLILYSHLSIHPPIHPPIHLPIHLPIQELTLSLAHKVIYSLIHSPALQWTRSVINSKFLHNIKIQSIFQPLAPGVALEGAKAPTGKRWPLIGERSLGKKIWCTWILSPCRLGR